MLARDSKAVSVALIISFLLAMLKYSFDVKGFGFYTNTSLAIR